MKPAPGLYNLPVQSRSKSRIFRWAVAAALLIFAATLFLLALSHRRDRVTFPNGLTVQWLGLTEGTNQFVDGNLIQKLLGDRIPARGLNLGFITLPPPRKFDSHQATGHVAWFRLSGENPPSYGAMAPEWYGFKVSFRNSSGRELEIRDPMYYTSTRTNALFSIPMTAYPRNEPKVTLRVGTPPDEKLPQYWAEFEFKTPGRATVLPKWKLQSLPATNYVDGIPIILRSASESSARLTISLPSPEWSIPECVISDQEGNSYSWMTIQHPTPPKTESLITFPDTFGTGRPWHLRMRLAHVRGFTKDRSHPLPMRQFPADVSRRITLSRGAPPVTITNHLGEPFQCVLEDQQIKIKGTTPERPYWALISASDGTNELEPQGYGWQNPWPKQPLGVQLFFLPENATNLTLELASPQVLSTEFYLQPAD